MECLRNRQIVVFTGLFFLTIVYFYQSSDPGAIIPLTENRVDSFSWSASVSLVKKCLYNFQCLPNVWNTEKLSYLVDTVSCKIVDLDPFDSSATKFLKDNVTPMQCKKPLVQLDKQTLIIDKTLIKNYRSCCYRELTRVTQSSTKYTSSADWVNVLSKDCYPIFPNSTTMVTTPFIKIECENVTSEVTKYIDFLAVPLSPKDHSQETAARAGMWDSRRESGVEIPPSILIIGIDSTSRLHMKRQLPRTGEYLARHDFIEMKGYTKIGDNTFPNAMGFLAGLLPQQYPGCWATRATKIDDCGFIWKNFTQKGYVTGLLEDAPQIAIFNYAKTGFVTAPTDYYLRPLMVGAHKDGKEFKASGNGCFEGLSPTDFMAKYIQRFLSANGGSYPYFLLSWFTSISHDDFNMLKVTDNTFRHLLQEAVENPDYGSNNTVILFISDHGYRFGSFRETFLGFYEESLPFFFIRIPPSLKARFPHWYKNLNTNAQRLTTPFDLHETFKDILNLPIRKITSKENANSAFPSDSSEYPIRNPNFRHRYSFFEETPENRTCESSQIPSTYCMCGVSPEVGKASGIYVDLAKFVLTELNSNVLESSIRDKLCMELKFSKVIYGRESGSGDFWNGFGVLSQYRDFVVALETQPGAGHFEARFRVFPNGTEALTDQISRINTYQGQSDCVNDAQLKKYCMCKDAFELQQAAKNKKKQAKVQTH